MKTLNYKNFYPYLGQVFKFDDSVCGEHVLKCILPTKRLPCYFSSPTGGCVRCSCPLTCDCTDVNGYKVQFTPVSMITEKEELYVVQMRYYMVGKGWGEWNDNYPYKVYTKKEAEAVQKKLLRESGDCLDYRVLKLC